MPQAGGGTGGLFTHPTWTLFDWLLFCQSAGVRAAATCSQLLEQAGLRDVDLDCISEEKLIEIGIKSVTFTTTPVTVLDCALIS